MTKLKPARHHKIGLSIILLGIILSAAGLALPGRAQDLLTIISIVLILVGLAVVEPGLIS
jgi:hypothetical protein